MKNSPPSKYYGVLRRENPATPLDELVEQVQRNGYCVFDPALDSGAVSAISVAFDNVHKSYVTKWGEDFLRDHDELNSIRLPMAVELQPFLDIASMPELLRLVGSLIEGSFLLNQQNGVINPPGDRYNQGAWHRDLPYQHYVSNSPLAINALYCVDDFTTENGSTWVLPASHRSEAFPSEHFLESNALQVTATAGQFIILDCMTYHSGGFNSTTKSRRAINHVYTIPYFKQQIRIPGQVDASTLTAAQADLLGFKYAEPASVEQYLRQRSR